MQAIELTDTVDVQLLVLTLTDVGQHEAWVTQFTGIKACVAPLYDNVNFQAWGSNHSHNIFRIILRTGTVKAMGILTSQFAKVQYLWTNKVGLQRTLRPIEDMEFPGTSPKRFGYIRCEDFTNYSKTPDNTPA